ncbi:MAG: YceI family protein [Comamonadaceae bacterium]|nr:YceI family protein [Comamonadaceae bacterium]
MPLTTLASPAAPLTLSCLLFAPAAQAQARPRSCCPRRARSPSRRRQMGVPVEGRFGQLRARRSRSIRRSPRPAASALTIDTGSARFGTAELDGRDRPSRSGWRRRGSRRRRSSRRRSSAAGAGRFEVAGRLTIKGATQRRRGAGAAHAEPAPPAPPAAASTIKRLAFKVGDGEWADTSMLADDVQIRFKLALTGLAPL